MWEVQMYTAYGWETVYAFDDREEACESRDNYRVNDPNNSYRVALARD